MSSKKGATFGIQHLTVVPHSAGQLHARRETAVEQGPTRYDD